MGPMRLFNLSLCRTGTRSVHELWRRAGVSSIHWPAVVDGIDLQAKIGGRETDPEFILGALAPVFSAFEAVGDVPIPALSRQLAARFADARFVAMLRPTNGWIASVRKHFGERTLAPYPRAVLYRYFRQQPETIAELSDDDLAGFYLWHYSDLEHAFGRDGRLLMVALADPQAGRKICQFCGLPSKALWKIDLVDRHWIGGGIGGGETAASPANSAQRQALKNLKKAIKQAVKRWQRTAERTLRLQRLVLLPIEIVKTVAWQRCRDSDAPLLDVVTACDPRDDADILEQWLRHHLACGIDRIFLYGDGEIAKAVAGKFSGQVTAVAETGSSGAIYRHYRNHHAQERSWTIFLGRDEALRTGEGYTVPQVVAAANRRGFTKIALPPVRPLGRERALDAVFSLRTFAKARFIIWPEVRDTPVAGRALTMDRNILRLHRFALDGTLRDGAHRDPTAALPDALLDVMAQ
jgi:hypothetical protein